MLACIAILIIFFALPDNYTSALLRYKSVFWLETIAFMSFGFSWLVKGKAITNVIYIDARKLNA